MEKRARIVDGPEYGDFINLHPNYARLKNPSRKALFFLQDSESKYNGGEMVILLVISKVVWTEDRNRGWIFEGEAGGRSFKGFFSTGAKEGWIEAVPLK